VIAITSPFIFDEGKNALNLVRQKWLDCRFGHADQANGPHRREGTDFIIDLKQGVVKKITIESLASQSLFNAGPPGSGRR
jgi:hypothetical protein